MTRRRTLERGARTTGAKRRFAGTRALVNALALIAVIACGGGGWRCEVTMVMDGLTVSGTGTGQSRDFALATARRNACEQLNLDDLQLRRCEQGLNPGTGTWSLSEDCEMTQ